MTRDTPKIVVVGADAASCAPVQRALDGLEPVSAVALAAAAPDAAIVVHDPPGADAFDVLRRAPACAVLVLAREPAPALRRALLRAGAADCLPWPSPPEALRRALDDALDRSIADRERVERRLRDSEARFSALADDIPQLVWITDEAGRITWCNRRWFEYTGGRVEDTLVRDWWAFHHPDHVDTVRHKLERHLESGEAWEDTFPLRGRDGRYRWFLSRAMPIRDETGRVVRWFGTNTDVTAQREAEQALRDADRRKDEFLAMLAHELRNPLAPIRHAVEVLRLVGPDEPALRQAADVVDRQAAHMARLVDDLLDVSRIARGRVTLRSERCDLADIVRQSAEDYRANLEAAGLALVVDVPAGPVWMQGDPTRLAQMVGNLLHNASKFTPAGGRVTVRLAVDAPNVMLAVEDTGVGIATDLLPRLFDPFSQAAQGLDRGRGGLGLGLALVKGIALLHGGSVTAHSDGPGRGATFRLRLPLAEPGRTAAAPESAPAPAGGARVLLIEDNVDAAEALRMLLALHGHEVTVAADGVAGLEAARSLRPDAVLCDIGLPGAMDGYAVARTLRAESMTALLVALSGYGQEEDRRRSREAGFDLHLVKPVPWSELAKVLAGLPHRAH